MPKVIFNVYSNTFFVYSAVKFCGDTKPCTLWSSGTALTVEFTSDAVGTALGFRLEYSVQDSKDE